MKTVVTSILAGIAVLALNLDPGSPRHHAPAPSGSEIDGAVAHAEAQAELR